MNNPQFLVCAFYAEDSSGKSYWWGEVDLVGEDRQSKFIEFLSGPYTSRDPAFTDAATWLAGHPVGRAKGDAGL